ncbi:MAG: DUF885 domain-containing protein [Actinomycetia bacterium]|nr:DUF885 domain-containing protein [Actinomycetes bacterium]MCH9800068.1 DUF885 domain-containing protein [Actinomycetes bacterium]
MAQVAVFADRVVTDIAAQDPCLSAVLGVANEGLTDFGPAACQERVELMSSLLAQAEELPIDTDADRISRDLLVERLGAWVDLGQAGEYLRDLNTMDSPPQQIRTTVELLAHGGDSSALTDVVRAIPDSLAGWRESLQQGAAAGLVASRRQSVAVAEQLSGYAGLWLPQQIQTVGGGPELAAAVADATAAFRLTAMWLADVYVEWARPVDGVGESDYLLHARMFTGMDLDLDEVMRWGMTEMARVGGLIRDAAAELDSQLRLDQVADVLQHDSRYQLADEASLTQYLRQRVDRTFDLIDSTLFDIDPRLRELRIQLVKDDVGLMPYYLPPSEDFTRPGTMCFPITSGDTYPRWQLDALCLHESVPGHHLQLGGMVAADSLNRFSRTLGSTTGHAEGWAMYAEWLGEEQGWYEDPITRLGYLSLQMLRAVRLVVDIGLHTDRVIPAGFPGAGSPMTADRARELLQRQALASKQIAAGEVQRYLGLPGQAISYKLGEREWLRARQQAEAQEPADFNLRQWHSDALALGSMGLAQFGREMAALNR